MKQLQRTDGPSIRTHGHVDRRFAAQLIDQSEVKNRSSTLITSSAKPTAHHGAPPSVETTESGCREESRLKSVPRKLGQVMPIRWIQGWGQRLGQPPFSASVQPPGSASLELGAGRGCTCRPFRKPIRMRMSATSKNGFSTGHHLTSPHLTDPCPHCSHTPCCATA